ncbi:MAG: hypothetical protein LLF76_03135 [Planctomycetaceae bacterium]|nr:hypothetical protein [Planctomycetaceae bacterium]
MENENYEKAVEIARVNGRVGIALLQTCLRVTYIQASILMQNMQVEGVIGHTADAEGMYRYIQKEDPKF